MSQRQATLMAIYVQPHIAARLLESQQVCESGLCDKNAMHVEGFSCLKCHRQGEKPFNKISFAPFPLTRLRLIFDVSPTIQSLFQALSGSFGWRIQDLCTLDPQIPDGVRV